MTSVVSSPDSQPVIIIELLWPDVPAAYYAQIPTRTWGDGWSKHWLPSHTWSGDSFDLCVDPSHPELSELITEKELDLALAQWAERAMK